MLQRRRALLSGQALFARKLVLLSLFLLAISAYTPPSDGLLPGAAGVSCVPSENAGGVGWHSFTIWSGTSRLTASTLTRPSWKWPRPWWNATLEQSPCWRTAH